MKLLYLGTACDEQEYDRIMAQSTLKSSTAPLVFESALLKAMSDMSVDADVMSFPQIPHKRYSGIPAWGRKREKLSCGYTCTWIPTVNLPILKVISRRICGYFMIREWLKQNRNTDDAAILMYSICPFLAKSVVRLKKKYQKKCIVIVPDLPENMFMNHKLHGIKKLLAKLYISSAVRVQNRFDGYVYLTEHMKEKIGADAPSLVVEGIADADLFNGIVKKEHDKRAVMYAGRLHESYGVRNLIDAFQMIGAENSQLWLFGSGSMEEEIKRRSEEDPSIVFFGQQPHDKVLEFERNATLLVNCRNPSDEFVKYSFPSKTMEYMLSGTAVLTTALPGIPNEYCEHLFAAPDNSAQTLSNVIRSILDKPKKQLEEIGSRARAFIINEKNAARQVEKILHLIYEVMR